MAASHPATASDDSASARPVPALDRIDAMLRRRHPDGPEQAEALARAHPNTMEARVLAARGAQQTGDYVRAGQHCQAAVLLAPERLDLRVMAAEAEVYCGRVAQAVTALRALDREADYPPAIAKQLFRLLTEVRDYAGAYAVADALAHRTPRDPGALAMKAAAATPLGRMGEAEKLADAVLALAPHAGEVAYNRATLRRQTPDRNHIADLEQRIASAPGGSADGAGLHYALGKELEDLGRHDEAFEAFARGAQARRARLRYDVATDVDAIDAVIGAFDGDWAANTADGTSHAAPIFVLGLPRSGTTLVDRILSSHPDVESLGELNDVTFAVMRAAGPAKAKGALIAQAARTDVDRIGREYAAAVAGYGATAEHVLDKAPLNALYAGLIAKALPKATIIHVHRAPMASGYALFKTYFRMGYPYSYALDDIGRYVAAHRRLMAHWDAVLPGRIIDVSYEALVDDQEGVSRRLVADCGLHWDEACLRFEENAAAVATASAAQVRQPLYAHAKEAWRRHEARLEPLRLALTDGAPA